MTQIRDIGNALSKAPFRIIEPGQRARAAVAIVLEETPAGVAVLFVERSTNEKDPWSGHIAFPGGRVESADKSAREAAEREAQEELGLNLARSRYLGRVSDVAPGALDIVISGFVYAVQQPPLLSLRQEEIAAAFWLPLHELRKPLHRSFLEFTWRERVRRYPSLDRFQEHEKPIWGITYRMFRNFDKAVRPGSGQEKETTTCHHLP